MFQGKLCFPPLPSTVFYRIISSFIPLNTDICHTSWIRMPSATLCPACTRCFRGTNALGHVCSAVRATEVLVLFFSSSWILKLLTSLPIRLVQRKLYLEVCNLTMLRESCEAHYFHLCQQSRIIEIILPFAQNTQ